MFQDARAAAIIGSPLSPKFLAEIGAMPDLKLPPGGFRPDGAWTHSYRIFTCRGYVDDGNTGAGFLKLERISGSGDFFALNIAQQVLHDGGCVHRIDAELRCRNDALASPAEWRLESGIRDWEGTELANLRSSETGRVASGTIEIVRGARSARQRVSGQVTGDFTLFEAIQRLPFTRGAPLEFDFLEGLSLHRPGHRLYYDGVLESGLHRFHHSGHGVGPYEYWLDDNHLLRLVVSHARAYIFDDKAEEISRRQMQAERERSRRRAAKKGTNQ